MSKSPVLVVTLWASLVADVWCAPVETEDGVSAGTGAWAVRVVYPHRERMPIAAHPPKRVQDLKGKHVVLPYAQSRDDALACVKAWRDMRENPLRDEDGKEIMVGNKQRPYSSWGEDVNALSKLLLKNKGDDGIPDLWSDGLSESTSFVFMEMGAFDGVSEANTALYERCLNWTGILVEANPTIYPRLVLARRTGSFLVHVSATCPRSEENGFGKSTETVQIEAHQYTSATVFDVTDESKQVGATPNPKHFRSVPCTDLSSVLTNTIGARDGYLKKIPDLFFLDVEGSELNVLKTLNLETHKIPIIIAEAQNRQCGAVCPKRDAVRALMTKGRYAVKELNTVISHSDVFLSEE
eukprot:m.442574 g.442574  ORF g.442574 m.442574 type:complete len:353 (-) comp18822_c0_seq1:74-1132(-)